MTKKDCSYLSYLLRLRQVTGREGPVWRVSLEEPSSGERYNFVNLDVLCDFLHKQIEGRFEVVEPSLSDLDRMFY